MRRPISVGRLGAVDHAHEVPTGQRADLGEPIGQLCLDRDALISAADSVGTTSTWQVAMSPTWVAVVAPLPMRATWTHWCRLAEVVPLLVEATVGAQQVAVVGGADQHGVLGATVGDGLAHPVERAVHLGVQRQ